MTPDPALGGRRCAVLGSPIAHSLSPALHRAAYAQLGLAWTYEAYEVGAAELGEFVGGCDASWRGLSLTMPLKEAALALGEPDGDARLAGGANTLVFEPNGRRVVLNTDVPGLEQALRAAGVDGSASAVLLGSGATARAALVSVARLGCRAVTVSARSPQRAEPLVDLGARLGVEVTVQPWEAVVPPADLLVSTVAAGGPDPRAGEYAAAAPVVFDVVYDPWPTRLALAAEEAGRTVVNGLDLLAHQAVGQLRAMTGAEVAPGLLLAAGRAELAARGRSAARGEPAAGAR